MKKKTAFILALLFTAALCGCNDTGKKSNEVLQDLSDSTLEITDVLQNAVPVDWGITLVAENVTPTGLSIVCHQSGGENVAELDTGSFYTIQKSENSNWKTLEYLPHEFEIGWTAEAWIIQKDGTTTWDVNWEWLYGALPAGKYRIGKEIMNFRETGNYDIEMVYAEFVIE